MLRYRQDGQKGNTMAYQRKKNMEKQKEKKEPEFIKVDSLVVTRVKRGQDWEIFDMQLNGVNIYGCRIVDGKNGSFVSFPSRRGTDGKYYSHAFAMLDDDAVKSICDQIDNWKD